jgi:hypothetical protein
MQIGQCFHRGLRGAQFHVGASHGIEHPGGDHDHNARFNLDVNDLAVGALLAVLAPDATSIQRVPAIEDLNFLPDMGRMIQRLLWDGAIGSSSAASWRANGPRW